MGFEEDVVAEDVPHLETGVEGAEGAEDGDGVGPLEDGAEMGERALAVAVLERRIGLHNNRLQLITQRYPIPPDIIPINHLNRQIPTPSLIHPTFQ